MVKYLLAFLGALGGPISYIHAEVPAPIADNSFLIEEAYNQEPGVVQHINTWQWNENDRSWDYTFTQEWPFLSQTHQLSYTLPVSNMSDPDHTGIGDILLNYRYQMLPNESLAIAPRFSLILPTGDEDRGLGGDSLGYQFNLPVSLVLSKQLVSHFNLGATLIPDEHNLEGASARTDGFNAGASLIYLASPNFNLMLEVLGASSESVERRNSTTREESVTINPGFRYAINFESGLQIVPGFAIPFGVGKTSGDFSLFTYLSLEHPFG